MARLFVIAVAALLAVPAAHAADTCTAPKADTTVASLSWLTGDWIDTSKSRVVREQWSGPYGGVLLGVGVTTEGDAAKFFEFLRIAKTPTGFSYFASPNARAATEFKAIELCADKVVFEAKEHDFPQRVIYRKAADGTLRARIEGTLNGKFESEDWAYTPER